MDDGISTMSLDDMLRGFTEPADSNYISCGKVIDNLSLTPMQQAFVLQPRTTLNDGVSKNTR